MVAMIGGILTQMMRAALTIPAAAPAASPTRIDTGQGIPACMLAAAARLPRVNTAPMERSMPPPVNTIVSPTPRMNVVTAARNSSMMFPPSRKIGFAT